MDIIIALLRTARLPIQRSFGVPCHATFSTTHFSGGRFFPDAASIQEAAKTLA
jgi:hypothetical protein